MVAGGVAGCLVVILSSLWGLQSRKLAAAVCPFGARGAWGSV